MGGSGSGRWGCHSKATAVEDCKALDLGVIVRAGPVEAGRAGMVRWLRGEVEVGVIGYELVRLAGGGLAVRLGYRWIHPLSGSRDVILDVPLEAAPLPRGGVRWWGRCPLALAGVPCGRRVGKLYLAPGCPDFACRRCHRLAYRSSQEHDPRVTRLAADPRALGRITRNPRRAGFRDLMLALQALDVLRRRDERFFRRFEAKKRRRK
jgi:hypothetical protein